ncbi:hypothetical protein DID88_004443 [Monilinia fructigena]|uniref:USP domain-containing protein n=1 Tax=Monilinia fructigena TaxID=38457 RepID=A0A395IRA4_9HELO|nr:hypothetical protein DID88_004443 [Monilinia fructigena]
MSPAAIGGPHLRPTSINGIGPIHTTNREEVNDINTLKGESRVLPHLDDLVNAKPLVDRQSSLRKLLDAGEAAAKQAETWLDFKRPELALQEYIIAFTIAVEYIPQSPNYHDLRTKPDYSRLYAGLQKRLNTQHSKFEEVKKSIKEDNARSGISPTNASPNNEQTASGNSRINGCTPIESSTYSNATNGKSGAISTSRGIESRSKPAIQPKPQGLHGKSIQTVNSISSSLPISSENDLAARFARLRSLNNPTLIQDPRIRTQHIVIPDEIIADRKPANVVSQPKQNTRMLRPLGPREMPTSSAIPLKTEKPILDMDTSVPMMPRVPDAIYSPAGSADVVSGNSQPPSISRGSSNLSGRRESSTSVQKINRNRMVADDTTDYFATSKVNNYTFDHNSHPDPETTPNKLSIPDSTSVTADELYNYLKLGSNTLSILLVDIRSREEFDEGHIMSQSIICIEPISIQKEMSAEDLGERIVLSPESEQMLYNQRHTFDLIVYYDQSSTSTLTNIEHVPVETLKPLNFFSMIIYDHAYDNRLKRQPKLLTGGLDAWVDLVGSGLPRSRTLSAAEEEKWDMAIKRYAEHEDAPPEDVTMDEAYYARTTDDFMRRYPELPSSKQSMALPSMPSSLPLYDGSIISAPPARPPPALPRQRSNGISEKTPYQSYAMTGGNSSVPPLIDPGLCGLRNITGALCYMNSIIQAISVAPAIRNLFIRFQYPCNPPIPKKSDEDSPPKQLMTRALRSLLQHMWCGKYQEIVPRMFQQYVHAAAASYKGQIGAGASHRSINEHRPDSTFGTSRQHDANEFLQWLFEVMIDEVNIHRDRTGFAYKGWERDEASELPRTQNCRQAYEKTLKILDSPLQTLIGCQTMYEVTCQTCGKRDVFSEPLGNLMFVSLESLEAKDRVQNLHDLLRNHFITEVREDIKCDSCNVNRAKSYKCLINYLPDYLYIPIKISQLVPQGANYRANIDFRFPQVLDMGEYTWLSTRDEFSERVLPKQRPPFLYDCFAAVQHRGAADAGHYWTIGRRVNAKNEWTDEWHEFNDSRVIAGKTFADTQGTATIMVVYRRQGAP